MKKSVRDKLPVLARKSFDKAMDNQYVAFHPDMLSKILSNDLLKPATTLLLQLKPNQKIQYVELEELKFRDIFLEIGLIKPTKKVGIDRFVVPKTSAYCSVEM
jgi:hypothetical protein